MNINTETIERIQSLIATNHNFVITTHFNSDGDAIGSATAMAEVLTQMNKSVQIVLPNDFPEFLKWLYGAKQIINFEKHTAESREKIANADVIICLDINALSRIEDMEDLVANSSKPRIVIDHHLGMQIEAEAIVSDPKSAATCELVYHTLVACGYEQFINRNVAESLYLGILTDTNRLDYSSSYAEVYNVMGKLVEKGIRKTFIHDRIYNVYTYDRMRLLGILLKDNFVYMPDYHAAYLVITQRNKKECNFQLGDSEGFVNFPLQIKNVKFCAMFTEYDNGTVKLSFRSKRNFPANKFAEEYFSGGGHFNAAGGRFHGKLDDAVKIFTEGLEKYKDLLEG